jgi:short-subunit dehydrogenase
MSTTLITGASSGIGRSLARRIAAHGESVALVARRKPLLDTLVNEIVESGGTACAIECDVTRKEDVVAAVHEAQRMFGPIDRLIANAGGGEPTFVESFSASSIAQVIALNVLGTANCIEAVLPSMIERRAGHIVATGSLASYRGLPTAAAYSASKAALTNLMESLRIDLKPLGIDVTLVLPGFVRTKPSRKKKRLLEMDLEDATERIHRAIQKRKRYYAFPKSLALLLTVLRLLPATAYDRLLAGRGRKPKKLA